MSDFKEVASWIGQKQRRGRAVREKVHRAYAQYVSEGKTADAVYPVLVERFGEEFQSVFGRELTQTVFENIVSRPMGAVGDSLTQAVLVTKVQRLADSCEEQIAEIDDLLDATDSRPMDSWVDMNQEDTAGGKFEGTKTKRIPLSEYRQDLMERRHRAHLAFFEAIKTLLPRDRVNVMVKDGDVTVLADQDLDRQLERFNDSRRAVGE